MKVLFDGVVCLLMPLSMVQVRRSFSFHWIFWDLITEHPRSMSTAGLLFVCEDARETLLSHIEFHDVGMCFKIEVPCTRFIIASNKMELVFIIVPKNNPSFSQGNGASLWKIKPNLLRQPLVLQTSGNITREAWRNTPHTSVQSHEKAGVICAHWALTKVSRLVCSTLE